MLGNHRSNESWRTRNLVTIRQCMNAYLLDLDPVVNFFAVFLATAHQARRGLMFFENLAQAPLQSRQRLLILARRFQRLSLPKLLREMGVFFVAAATA